jgi:hypothetical protein
MPQRSSLNEYRVKHIHSDDKVLHTCTPYPANARILLEDHQMRFRVGVKEEPGKSDATQACSDRCLNTMYWLWN